MAHSPKAALRKQVRDRIRGLDPRSARAAAAAATAALVETAEVRGAAKVGLFASLPDEISTRPLLDALVALGKRCLLPRVGQDAGLQLVAVEGWTDLAPGRFGVLEPPRGGPAGQLGPGDLLVVPGTAFDPRGARLGRGAGIYDRYLDSLGESGPKRFGFAYHLQIVDRVPVEAHDQAVDAIVTERGVERVVPVPDRASVSGDSEKSPSPPLDRDVTVS